MNQIKILVVEDEMIIAAKISLLLTKLGYEVTGIVPRGEEAIVHVAQNEPDIVILDINLKGDLDGIQTARIIQENNTLAVIYLTANADAATFDRAKITRPHAFISKPFNTLDLQRAVELTAERIFERTFEKLDNPETPTSNFLPDRIFVKHKEKMVKLFLADILYLEADRSYCNIFTKADQYVLSVPLKNVEAKLPPGQFIRVHRSYLVNILQIDEVDESHVFINKKAIPLSHSSKEELMKRLQRV